MPGGAGNLISEAGWREIARRFGLTARQVEIAQLVCCALRNPDIAAKLGVTADTVRVHLKDVFRKMGAHSRVELVVLCVQVDRERRGEVVHLRAGEGIDEGRFRRAPLPLKACENVR